jgi:hypothetical protein
MACDVDEKALEGLGIEEMGEEGIDVVVKRRDEALLYPPPTHARCRAACRLFFTTCAIESDRCSGVDVSVLWSSGNWGWSVGRTTCCKNSAMKRPANKPVNKERAAKAMTCNDG